MSDQRDVRYDASEARDNAELNELERQEGCTVLESRPVAAWLGLTTRCNLRCNMCARSYGRPEVVDMTDEEFALVAADVLRVVSRVNFCGYGESFCHPSWDRIEAAIIEQGIPYSITTNGTLFSQHRVRRVIDGRATVVISMDAATERTFGQIRRGGRLRDVLFGLEELVRQGAASRGCRLVFQTTVQALNIAEIPSIVDLAYRLGVSEVRIQRLDTSGLPDECRALRPDDEGRLRRAISEAKSAAEQTGVALSVCDDLVRVPADTACLDGPDRGAASSSETVGCRNSARCRVPCWAPWQDIQVTVPQNSVIPCCVAGGVLGHLQGGGLDAVWNSPRYAILRATVNSPSPIGRCRVNVCPMRVYMTYGLFSSHGESGSVA